MEHAALTPSICEAHGYRLTLSCTSCHRGAVLTGWKRRAFQLRWDMPLELIWQEVGFHCERCGRPADRAEVDRRSRLGNRFDTLLILERQAPASGASEP